MRFLLPAILTAAFAIPAMAQKDPAPTQESNPKAEIERLRETIKALEGKLTSKEGAEKKPDEKKGDEKKGDEKKGDEKKGDEKRGDEKRGDEKRGDEKRGDEKKPDPKKGDEKRGDEKKPDPKNGEFNKHEPLFGRGLEKANFAKLSPEEQAIFKKLLMKMTDPDQPEIRKSEGADKSGGGKTEPQKPSAKQSVEDRLERLERMIQDLIRTREGKR